MTCTVLLPPPSGPTKFRTTVVKRFLVDTDEQRATDEGTTLEQEQLTRLITGADAAPQALTMHIRSEPDELKNDQDELMAVIAFPTNMVP